MSDSGIHWTSLAVFVGFFCSSGFLALLRRAGNRVRFFCRKGICIRHHRRADNSYSARASDLVKIRFRPKIFALASNASCADGRNVLSCREQPLKEGSARPFRIRSAEMSLCQVRSYGQGSRPYKPPLLETAL